MGAFDNLYRLAYAWVAVDREVVFVFDDGTSFFYVSSYHSLTLMIPDIVDLFELMGIYPCLGFVLRLVVLLQG